jgi:hypothetical protein
MTDGGGRWTQAQRHLAAFGIDLGVPDDFSRSDDDAWLQGQLYGFFFWRAIPILAELQRKEQLRHEGRVLTRSLDSVSIGIIQSDEISMSSVDFPDGSAAIMIHRALLDWTTLLSQLVELFDQVSPRSEWRIPRRYEGLKLTSTILRSRINVAKFRPDYNCVQLEDVSGFLGQNGTSIIPVFMLLHEISHYLLFHSPSSGLPGDRSKTDSRRQELEADSLAAELLLLMDDESPDLLRGYSNSAEPDRLIDMLKLLHALFIIWQDALFIRLPPSHPSAVKRWNDTVQLLKANEQRSSGFNNRRRYRRAKWRNSLLFGYWVETALAREPLPYTWWCEAGQSPFLTADDRKSLEVGTILDPFLALENDALDGMSADALAMPAEIVRLRADLTRVVDWTALLVSAGLPAPAMVQLCDKSRALTYHAALRLVEEMAVIDPGLDWSVRRLQAAMILQVIIPHLERREPELQGR